MDKSERINSMGPANVIFQDKDTKLWHFWFETYMDYSEGYETQKECYEAFNEYCKEYLL